ncbi:MAG: signal peptidase I [Oscillospiraceae bacterium]|nr:signal peptidase I [Oscillospiraceae bacterium]
METHPLNTQQVLQEKKKLFLRRQSWIRLVISLLCTAAVTFFLFSTVLGIASIRGTSMNPALYEKDVVLFFRLGHYKAGDIVILKAQDNLQEEYIKRIIGVPGDTVDIDDSGRVILNGNPLKEPYAVGVTQKKESVQYPLTLGTEQYFVLGDNRENSLDSRNYGPVTASQIEGKAVALLRVADRTHPH